MTKEEMWDRLKTSEFPSIRPDVVRDWIRENPDDDSLAKALAQVCNCVGALHHSINESDDPWLKYVYYDWYELEEELFTECISRLEANGEPPAVQGRHYRILPYMEKHGYRDGHGWWIKKED